MWFRIEGHDIMVHSLNDRPIVCGPGLSSEDSERLTEKLSLAIEAAYEEKRLAKVKTHRIMGNLIKRRRRAENEKQRQANAWRECVSLLQQLKYTLRKLPK